ncbi:hypothetical protein MKK65_10675 [Methylobacterium sp. J-001]|uniref:hypothetical protein n=1 Tax=Methylobacterium sp. J-001 TaxID=2836609 RepID=UPI001FBA9A51|nr:hypothetical protein [Methylobacterium sp. J-001]MCJ2117028.1 hypothetical protein [Methylobacterium sp. J-001]
MTASTTDPRAMADAIFEAGSRPEDVRDALARLGAGAPEFLGRLAARAAASGEPHAIERLDGIAGEETMTSALLGRVQADYEVQKAANSASTKAKDLGNLPAWMSAQAAFGNDVTFIIKLAQRSVSPPTGRFLRYVADSLGVAIGQVRQHFADTSPRGLAGVEAKSSGKPDVNRVEDFAVAVGRADVPEELRARWLSE